MHRALAGDAAVAELDHIASTQAAADRRSAARPPRPAASGAPPPSGPSRWSPPPTWRPTSRAHVRRSVGALLLVRAFELWTHENDIRRGRGRPPSIPDAPTLR